MESPETLRHKTREDDAGFGKLNSTPRNHKVTEEFSLYNLHKESSPSLKAGQDILEVGWGNSPEPLKVEKKSALIRTPVTCKKKLESRESPVSSISSKRRNFRSKLRIQSSSVEDISRYVAEVQELSKSIMKELNANAIEKEVDENVNQLKNCVSSQKSVINQKLISDNHNSINFKIENFASEKDSSFDCVLQNFIDEEDDWLSQAFSNQESPKSLSKISFIKCKSENQLSMKQSNCIELKTAACKSINNNFRRTASFDLKKSHGLLNSLNNSTMNNKLKGKINSMSAGTETVTKISQVQYSQQDIERKRLEAIYRRERNEIERKRQEALKRLELKKLRTLQT